MESVSVRLATAADLPAIGSLVVELCRDPEAHCIHSWTGESSDESAVGLARIHGQQELVYALAESADGVIGAFGCELDRELGLGWLHGPHARSDWHAGADRLRAVLGAELPPGMTELRAFLNVANKRGFEFYSRQGFDEQPMRHHEYLLPAGAAPAPVVRPRVEARHRPSFFELFDALFPKAYYSHERLMDMQGESHEIFITLAGDRVDGICIACRAADGQRGEIEFLGVREDKRRKGLGRDLLAAGITWLREVGVGEVTLTVADESGGARRLYAQAGFELRYTGVGLRLLASDGRPPALG